MKNLVFNIVKENKSVESFNCIEVINSIEGRGYAVLKMPELLIIQGNDIFSALLLESSKANDKNIFEEKLSDLSTPFSLFLYNLISKNIAKLRKPLNLKGLIYKNSRSEKTYFDLSLIPVHEGAEITYLMISFTDVTDKELMKERINDLEKQKEFFTFICHEFKTPLTVIISAIQAINLLYSKEITEKTAKYIKKIHQGALQQWRLVNHLLDILKADSGYLKVQKTNSDIVKMTKAITEAVSVYASSKNININFLAFTEKAVLAIDDEKYERIILNLLSNAIKFTPEGKNIYVRIKSKESNVYIEIQDEGIGIEKDKLKLIFERFVQIENSLTRQSEGTGIGLYLVKELADAMDCKIKVKSSPGTGSTFTLIIPFERCSESMDNLRNLNLTDDRLIETAKVEFSTIYFD